MAQAPVARTGLSLTWKIFAGTAGAVLLALAVTLFFTYRDALKAARATVENDLDEAARITTVILEDRQRSLRRSAQTFVENPEFRDLVRRGKRSAVYDQAVEAQEQIGAAWVQITDSAGTRLARSDEPGALAVSLASSPLVRTALNGESALGYGVSADSTLFAAVALPIATAGGNPVGVLMAASRADDDLALALQRLAGVDFVFFTGDSGGKVQVAASTLTRGPDLSRAVAAYVAARIPSDAPITQRVIRVRSEQFIARVEPLKSTGGQTIGGYMTLHLRAIQEQRFEDLRREIIEAGVAGLLIAFLLSFFLARSITHPLGQLLAATRRAAGGDYATPVEIQSNDEVGELGAALSVLLKELREQQALVNVLQTSGERKIVSRESAVAAAEAGTVLTGRALGPGTLFANRYEILGTLGQGGMGVVYKATDKQLGDVVAIKTLRSDFLSSDPTALERFKSEIRLARRISHRNVVRTHDIGEADGVHFITMEYIAGTSLHDLLIKKKRLPGAAAAAIGKQLARALEVAHEQGVIHRDIKPQNLVVQPDGVLKVMDFGIARLTERPKGMTRTGMVVGTPEYMAPEQLLGDEIDARADIYSAGIVLYECVTGGRPWVADSATVLIGKMMSEPPRPPIEVNPEVPPELSALIIRAIARDRDQRPATAAALADELDRLG